MVNTQQVTVVVAKATCSGVNAGFTSSKLSLCINPEPPGIVFDNLFLLICCLKSNLLQAKTWLEAILCAIDTLEIKETSFFISHAYICATVMLFYITINIIAVV